MQLRLVALLVASILTGCATRAPDGSVENSSHARSAAPVGTVSSASTLDAYKRDLAQRISQVNSDKVYAGQPQALLRSVVVLRYAVDGSGRLVHSEIMRSNRDRETESTALASLRNAAPFPRPASHLLRNGRLDLSETWLFNNDGRFQLRTIAEPQVGQ